VIFHSLPVDGGFSSSARRFGVKAAAVPLRSLSSPPASPVPLTPSLMPRAPATTKAVDQEEGAMALLEKEATRFAESLDDYEHVSESVGVSTGWVSWTFEPDDHIVYTPFTWTGTLPTELDATCRFVQQDMSGETNKDAYMGEEFILEGPSTEADRDGVLVFELPRDMRGAVECAELD
jgi:hypothetical protein